MPNLDWKNLPFSYLKTNYNLRCYFRNGKWGEIMKEKSETIELHIAATCLHYGQEIFEGMKAVQGRDGKIRIFRWEEHFKRMNSSAREIIMPELPKEIFRKMIFEVVRLNKEFVPPYESGAFLYIRPLLIGITPQLAIHPSSDYLFLIFVTPVGPYCKEGFKPLDFFLEQERDRAAPSGTGHVKAGGNYATSLQSIKKAAEAHCQLVLFLDPKEKKYIDECSAANFFAIKNNTYITPDSKSILPSITNRSLMTLAKDMGMKIERRKIELKELESFEEVGACGTAVVIAPAKRIIDSKNNRIYEYSPDGKPGPISTKLYNRLRAIQCGDEPDKFGWTTII